MRGVLVVDGAAFFRSYMERLIRGWGWPVAGSCATADEAREVYRREKPGVVVLDLFLPDGDGRKLLAELRRLDPEAAVVVCTAAADRASVAAALRLGARDYLVKPVDEERLRTALAACLGQPDGTEGRGGAAAADAGAGAVGLPGGGGR